ncbi:uncharacterized protein LOC129907262 [Episyrphus balteatus]|uniref:uncharacterized protein LOC129907262 n=1 Tax=Episyrphus balteatus TaxID=286459 RepID=UPI002485EB70|nr:uncharacterized protein LOC129907262 [Episyrphus balteatus]
MYGIQNCENVNDARYEIFTKTYKFKSVNETFAKKLKNVDASNLPPCKAELYQQLLRAQYVTTIWNNAYLQIPTLLRPQDHGWVEQNGKMELLWFEGDQSPKLVNDVIIQPTLTDGSTTDTDEYGTDDSINDDFASDIE